jgi:hypothetical protein
MIPINKFGLKDWKHIVSKKPALKSWLSLASESRDFKKPSESRIFEFYQKLFKYGTLQAKQK